MEKRIQITTDANLSIGNQAKADLDRVLAPYCDISTAATDTQFSRSMFYKTIDGTQYQCAHLDEVIDLKIPRINSTIPIPDDECVEIDNNKVCIYSPIDRFTRIGAVPNIVDNRLAIMPTGTIGRTNLHILDGLQNDVIRKTITVTSKSDSAPIYSLHIEIPGTGLLEEVPKVSSGEISDFDRYLYGSSPSVNYFPFRLLSNFNYVWQNNRPLNLIYDYNRLTYYFKNELDQYIYEVNKDKETDQYTMKRTSIYSSQFVKEELRYISIVAGCSNEDWNNGYFLNYLSNRVRIYITYEGSLDISSRRNLDNYKILIDYKGYIERGWSSVHYTCNIENLNSFMESIGFSIIPYYVYNNCTIDITKSNLDNYEWYLKFRFNYLISNPEDPARTEIGKDAEGKGYPLLCNEKTL